MVQDKRKFSSRQTFLLKGAFQVILGAITGVGLFLVIAVLVSNPEASYADRLSLAACNLVDECQQIVALD